MSTWDVGIFGGQPQVGWLVKGAGISSCKEQMETCRKWALIPAGFGFWGVNREGRSDLRNRTLP